MKLKKLGRMTQDHDTHADATNKKVQQRMFFLGKMKSFKVSSEMLSLFYGSFIKSVMSFCIAAWFGKNKNLLGLLVKTALFLIQ